MVSGILIYNDQYKDRILNFDIFNNPYFLNSNMNIVHKDVYKLLENKKSISLFSHNIKSFTNINPDDIYHILYLPPFLDEKTNNFLNSLDVIVVQDQLIKKSYQSSTQLYLRYILHIKPFLKKNKKNYLIRNFDGFGKLYIKK